MKKIIGLTACLLLLSSVALAGGDIVGNCIQRFTQVAAAGNSGTIGVAVSIRYLGSYTTGATVAFASTGATFYLDGAVDPNVGSTGVVLWGSINDSDTAWTSKGFVDAVNRTADWSATIVDATDMDSPACIFDTSTLTVHIATGNVYLEGDPDVLTTYAIGDETQCFEQIRVNVPSGRKVRFFYANAAATGGTIRILNAKTGVEIWRSAASATASIDPGTVGIDFFSDFVVRYKETGSLPLAAGEYLQIRYATMDKGEGY